MLAYIYILYTHFMPTFSLYPVYIPIIFKKYFILQCIHLFHTLTYSIYLFITHIYFILHLQFPKMNWGYLHLVNYNAVFNSILKF